MFPGLGNIAGLVGSEVDLGPFSYSNTGGMGDRTGFITVTANFTPTAGALPRIVDGNTANSDAASFKFQNGLTTGNIFTLDFGSLFQINQFTLITSISSSVGTWEFRGSVDDVVYDLLLSSFTLVSSTNNVHTPSTFDSYRYYRFIQTGGATQTSTRMIELQFSIRNG